MVKRIKAADPRRDGPSPGVGKRGAEGHIAYLLRQAQVAVRGAVERALAEFRVTLPQFSVLTLLAAYGELSAAEVARLSLLTPQTVTVIVRNLERDGLIARTPDPVHGRILRLALTEDGKRLHRRCRARADAVEARMVAGLSGGDESVIRAWLARLAAEMIAEPAKRRRG